MAISIFDSQGHQPEPDDLDAALREFKTLWHSIIANLNSEYSDVTQEWIYSKAGGWVLRLKRKKRTIIYMIPCDGYFMIGLVFGQKATDKALASSVSSEIKNVIESAKVYAEGRGFRLDVDDEDMIDDINELVRIKIEN